MPLSIRINESQYESSTTLFVLKPFLCLLWWRVYFLRFLQVLIKLGRLSDEDHEVPVNKLLVV